MMARLVVSVFALLVGLGGAAKILVLSPITSPSHSSFIKPVVRALARRGHEVTYWNGLGPDNATTSAGRVQVFWSEGLLAVNKRHPIRFEDRGRNFELFFEFPQRVAEYCHAICTDPVYRDLIALRSNESVSRNQKPFDVIIVEGMFNDCVMPLVRWFDAPFIYMSGIAPPPWLLNILGSPLALSVLPSPGFQFSDNMNIWQRTLNSVVTYGGVFYRDWIVTAAADRVIREDLSDLLPESAVQPIVDIERRQLSLLLTNTHLSINYQWPTDAAVVQAGGLHCSPAKPLPKDLEDFVNGSGSAGFIIVSFGSILKGAAMPETTRRMFVSTFQRLKQRVIWKWEDDDRMSQSDVPDNVLLLPWMPQQDLLGHPKARLFVTHGGLFSNQEAVYHGVPLIALPVFADQPLNALKAHRDGYGIHLNWDNMTERSLYDAIQQILTDPKYSMRVAQVSSLMHDQPDKPLDRATFWIEYVIRHKGASHLRSRTRWMNVFQRGLFDVLLVVFISCVFLLFLALKVGRLILRTLWGFIRLFLESSGNQCRAASPLLKKESMMTSEKRLKFKKTQ